MLMVAYEPVWAIGKHGTAASVEDVRTMSGHIRGCSKEIFGADASSVPVLYGGTVDMTNCSELLTAGSIDGLFIGRAAWNVDGFARPHRLLRRQRQVVSAASVFKTGVSTKYYLFRY
jgi:triosephosphate isomerase